MRCIYFENGELQPREAPIPRVEPEEALIKTSVVGICNTDIELLKGYYGFRGVAGHEFVGTVAEAPQSPGLVGKRVVGDINCGCGECEWCRWGDDRHCPERTVIGIKGRQGAFAEYLAVPQKNLHVVVDSIENEAAVFAEPLAAALEGAQQIHIKARSRLAVLGDGKLGLLIALALRHYAPDLVLFGKHAEKMKIASEQGVRIQPAESWKGQTSYSNSQGFQGSFHIVVEATGSPEGIGVAMDLAAPEGTVVVKTTSIQASTVDLSRIVVNELKIVGSRCGDLALALSFLRNGWVDVRPLIEAVYAFDDFQEAFARAQRPGSKKVLLAF